MLQTGYSPLNDYRNKLGKNGFLHVHNHGSPSKEAIIYRRNEGQTESNKLPVARSGPQPITFSTARVGDPRTRHVHTPE